VDVICFVGEIDLFEKIRQDSVCSDSSSGKQMFLVCEEAASFTEQGTLVLQISVRPMCY